MGRRSSAHLDSNDDEIDNFVGLSQRGRSATIQAQCHEAGAQLVGVQEARTDESSRTATHYHVFSSGRDESGCFGTELWVSKAFKISKTSVALVDSDDVQVVSSSPRHLLASVRTPMLQVDCLVAHAPCVKWTGSGWNIPEVKKWWEDITALAFGREDPSVPLIMMIDSNARNGSVVSYHIGNHAAAKENLAGSLFHQFMRDLKLFAPSTFSVLAKNHASTFWKHTSGSEARLDYVLFPCEWFSQTCEAGRNSAIDLAIRRIDHWAVFARGRVARTVSKEHCARRRLG